MMFGKNYGILVDVLPYIFTQSKLISREEIEKVEHLKKQKKVRIKFESDRFIIYSYTNDEYEIDMSFNTKFLIDWSKEQLQGVLNE